MVGAPDLGHRPTPLLMVGGQKVFVFNGLRYFDACKIFIRKGLQLKSSF
jgi:hypothetical protein